MDDLTTECNFDSQATWVIDVLDLFHDMLSMNVCATRHRHTSGRMVQELNVCTVPWIERHVAIIHAIYHQQTSLPCCCGQGLFT